VTEHRDPWPADKPPQERGVFQMYERFAVEQDVRLAFLDKYGYPPKYTLRTGGGWLAGPIGREHEMVKMEAGPSSQQIP